MTWEPDRRPRHSIWFDHRVRPASPALPTERRACFDPDRNRGNTVLMHRQPGDLWRIDHPLPPGESPEAALAPQALKVRIDAQLAIILNPAVDRSLPRQVLAVLDQSGPEGPHLSGEHAAHPIEPPSTALAALPILAMARAIAAVGAWPARPMTARSGAPNCRI